jgi:hypothetical protein
VAAWEDGRKVVEKAKLFSGGAFVLLLLLSVYSALMDDLWNAAYFAGVSVISLGLFFYVRKTFKVGTV